jgi:2-oxoglutarate dehydrogenase E1 component
MTYAPVIPCRQVVNCTTPANYFHVLRRQIHRDFRKPLIIATPKNLLREKKCTSTLDDISLSTKFRRVYSETDPAIVQNASKVKRVVFCTGKIYYELAEERSKRGINDVAIVRIEQIAPFPWDKVAKEMALYSHADALWCQEEPKNMGAWTFVQPRIATATRQINKKEIRPLYAGRKPSAATATGMGGKAHEAEQNAVLAAALTVV